MVAQCPCDCTPLWHVAAWCCSALPSLLRPSRMCTSAGTSCAGTASSVLHEQGHGALCSCCTAVVHCMSRGKVPSAHAIVLWRVVGHATVVAGCGHGAYCAAAPVSYMLSWCRSITVVRCMSRGLVPSAQAIAPHRVMGRVLWWSRHPAWCIGRAVSPSCRSCGTCASRSIVALQDCPLGQGDLEVPGWHLKGLWAGCCGGRGTRLGVLVT
jgi:hypothetical protein